MISRMYFSCSACESEIIVRAQVGYEKTQPHTFPCPSCESPISIKLILDNPPHVGIEHDDSCSIISDSSTGSIVNLGVGFLIPKDKADKEMYFPAMELLHAFRAEIKDKIQKGLRAPSNMPEHLIEGFPGAARAWRHLEKACRFHRNGRHELRDKNLNNFISEVNFRNEDFHTTLSNFIDCFIGPTGRSLATTVKEWAAEIQKKNPDEYLKLLEHYINDLSHDRLKEYTDLCSEYFKAHHEFEQTITYIRHDLTIPEDATASSADFESTKMFYGNAFELFGSHLDLIAALNNVAQGRPYEKFIHMDLKQYRSTDKAKRTECLKNEPKLAQLYSEYDSAVRNASHHRWFKISEDRQRITYKSGGTGASREMTYANYTAKCNTLFIQILTIFSLELKLTVDAKAKST